MICLLVVLVANVDAELDEQKLLKLQEETKKPKRIGNSDDSDMNNQDGSEDNNLQEFKNIKFQKLVYFAEKMGIIGDKQMNID